MNDSQRAAQLSAEVRLYPKGFPHRREGRLCALRQDLSAPRSSFTSTPLGWAVVVAMFMHQS